MAAQGGLREEVVGLYRSFREQTKEFYDAEDLAKAAAGAVRAGRTAGLSDLGFILFFQLSQHVCLGRKRVGCGLGQPPAGAPFCWGLPETRRLTRP